jgi:putative peptide zinc metalloprotease protein
VPREGPQGPSHSLSPKEPTLTITEKPTQVEAPEDGDERLQGHAPMLADGIELIGRYEDSGYEDPPFIARRSDGQMIQMPELLYLVAEQIDGKRDYGAIAEGVSEKLGRGVSAENVQTLVEEKLWPLGILAGPGGEQPQVQKLDPLLALKLRTAVVPKSLTKTLTTVFYPLFFPPVIVAMLAAVVAVDVWFFFFHGVAQPLRELAYNPVLMLMVLGLVVIATALHEIGHATATRYGGAEPGDMGVGIYVVWPAFYTDVTDAYRLGRGGRLRTDLGGVYFNGLFVLITAGLYAVTRFEPLLILIIVQHMQVLQQMLPFLRLDGYYILSDLVGVPDMFARIKPTLKSSLPGREVEDEAAALKPWVRRVTLLWVLILLPVLAFVFGMLIFNLPRMIATAWDSFFVQLDKITSGSGLDVAVGVVQILALLLPLAGITYTFARVGSRIASGAWSWSEGAPLRRAAVLAVTVVAAGVAGWVLLPNGDYRPIQTTERGTVLGGLQQFSSVGTGRPGLTEEREQELGGAPAVRDAPFENDQQEQPTQTDTTSTSTTETQTATTETTPTATEPAAGVTATVETPATTVSETVTTETTP